jgi:hypothetical protein
MSVDCCKGVGAECECRERKKRRDWASDARVLAEFCTCPTAKEWVLVDIDLDQMENLNVFDLNCPLHGVNAERSPF